jgi:hypothetical protein
MHRWIRQSSSQLIFAKMNVLMGKYLKKHDSNTIQIILRSSTKIYCQLALRVVAIGTVHDQVYIYLGHQVSNATMHYRFCQVGMD